MVASWWSRARLGIFVHRTPASVPGWAPPYVPPDGLPAAGRRAPLGWTSYAQWYENSLRFPGSPAAAHHRATFGIPAEQRLRLDRLAGEAGALTPDGPTPG